MYLSDGPMGLSETVRGEQAEAERYYAKLREAAAATRKRFAKLLDR